MNIVTVYPIIRGAFREELTYWSSHDFSIGSIIEVPLRGRNIHALVGKSESAKNAKSIIKNASFTTRKIEKKKEVQTVRPECIRACIDTADQYMSPLGQLIKACIPDIAFETIDTGARDVKSKAKDPVTSKEHEDKSNSDEDYSDEDEELNALDKQKLRASADMVVYQTNTEDRLGTYKSIVREEFARKKSVLIVCPTLASAQEVFETLKKGIDSYAVLLHGKLSKKKQLATWTNALNEDHTLLIVTTPLFASIPRHDISTIILEKESSRGYKTLVNPYFDFRDYIEKYAKNMGIRMILGDSLLRITTLYRRDQGELVDFFPISYRIDKEAEVLVVNTKERQKKAKAMKDTADADEISKIKAQAKFNVLSEELISMIDYAQKKNEKIFIFCSRRGLSPQTVCGDCGETVKCESCNAPVVLHQNKKIKSEDGLDRYFLCHHCGTQRSAMEKCKKCQSWNLTTLGIGIDTVGQEIKKLFPKGNIFTLDKDTVSTDVQARALMDKLEKAEGGILLGTESSLSYLSSIKYTAIASLDSLFSIPDFRINERIMHILLRILDKTDSYMLIQTRSENSEVLNHFNSGNLSQFYKDEISMRKDVMYPPFANHIKITVEETKSVATDMMKKLQDRLDALKKEKGVKDFSTLVFPAFVPAGKGRSILHMLISIKPEDLPNERLFGLLKSLPTTYQLRVNPESLL
jgi:primosomal protein N' (replication factor Y) (superfamily II helicase)